jgi:DNA-binding NarL/FixJ family response regulator
VPRTDPPPPEGPPASLIVLYSNGEDVASEVRAVRAQVPEAACLVLCPRRDLALARTALKAGARGFVHAGMTPEQLAHALEVASSGELVFPRGLLELLIREEAPPATLEGLSARQREVLGLVTEGLSNAQVAEKLFLAESTVKQRLSAAYKVLRVKNRSQAAKVFRRRNHAGGG